ncbi:hypothetical protein B296_00054499 [Ensete ventricosum]|uniref:Uncharacterized protein n=1 Tax=Ensete ventricosum TaxID=4639 RepID=A0A426Y3L9_ENSVE|nr:hypothetical protein B296_00054499 [Ensete ventricosum]
MGLFEWLDMELALLGAAREPVALMDLQLKDQPHVRQPYHVHPGVHHTVAEAAFHLWAEAHRDPGTGMKHLVAVHHEVAVGHLAPGSIPHHLDHLAGAVEDRMEPNPSLYHLPAAVDHDPSPMAAGALLAHWGCSTHEILSSPLDQKFQFCISQGTTADVKRS